MENEIGIIELVVLGFFIYFLSKKEIMICEVCTLYKTKTKEKKKKIYLKFDCQIFGCTISRIH